MWIVFGALITAVLALDLGVSSRKEHVVSMREALSWTCVWIGLALAFNVFVYLRMGEQLALQFLTGYIIEKALSVDNLFVFIVIFGFFAVPKQHQHRVLFWGVLGALVLRAVFIFVGVALISTFHWMIYLFGAFLIYTGVKILLGKEGETVDVSKSGLVRLFRRVVPMTESYDGPHFVSRVAGRARATPLLLVLVLIESSDVIFALDSIPAVLAISTDPFIVYTSNIFAILGLRNLYFVLANFMDRFEYLKVGLGLVLAFVGAKMAASGYYDLPIGVSLGVVAALLGGSVAYSLWHARRQHVRPSEG